MHFEHIALNTQIASRCKDRSQQPSTFFLMTLKVAAQQTIQSRFDLVRTQFHRVAEQLLFVT